MKKLPCYAVVMTALIFMALAAGVTGCDRDDGSGESIGRKFDDSMEKSKDAVGEAAEDVKEWSEETAEDVKEWSKDTKEKVEDKVD